MRIKNSKAIVIAVITLLDFFINIYNNVTTTENYIWTAVLCGMVLALCDVLLLFSIIEIANRPVLGMILLTLSQTFTIVLNILDGAVISEAFEDVGVAGLAVIIALIYHTVAAYKEVGKDKESVTTFKEKVINTVKYKRSIYSVKLHVRFIIYSLIISTILSLAGSEMLSLVNNSVSFRIYGAFVLIIPTMLIIGIITTSYIAYDLFIVKIIFEIYTLYLLAGIGEFNIVQIIYIIVEAIAIIYAYFVTFIDNVKKVGNKHGEKKS